MFMRVFIASLIIFAVLLGFGIFAYYYIDNTAHTLLTVTETVEKNVEAGEWQQAGKNFSKMYSSWNRISPKWTVLIDHQELDNINVSIFRVKKFMDTRDLPGFMTELAELKLLLKHIPEKEALNLKNIL